MIDTKELASLVKVLQNNKIICGVGGSYLLHLYNLCDNPADVDFWVDPKDMNRVRTLFKDCEQIHERIQLPDDLHYKFVYMDLKVDFVSCFITRPNQYSFSYYINAESIETIKITEGLSIPCTSLEDWYIVYKLLKRDKKAAMIADYIYKRDIQKTTLRLRQSMDSGKNILPKKIRTEISSFVMDNMQYSITELCSHG